MKEKPPTLDYRPPDPRKKPFLPLSGPAPLFVWIAGVVMAQGLMLCLVEIGLKAAGWLPDSFRPFIAAAVVGLFASAIIVLAIGSRRRRR